MKKIATITFHNAINVGAVLQAYALQKALHALGVQSEIIDYRNEHIQRAYSPFYLQHKTVSWFVKTMLVAPIRFVRNRRFKKFVNEHLQLSTPVKSDADFAALNATYDAFFTGSDQVWNPYHAGKVDGRYFLDFVTDSRKKKSYAASFGLTELPKEYAAEYSRLLGSFSTMLVREQSAVKMVKGLSPSKNPAVVLDPVFLLDKNDWNALAVSSPKLYGKYVLVFCVNGLTDDMVAYSLQVAKRQNAQVIYLARRPQRIPGVKVVTSFAPKEFLGYIQNAAYVVTDSFHATSFSILYHKEFSLKVASQHGHKNNRSLELLALLGIGNRVLNEPQDAIQWSQVDVQLAKQKQISLKYLRESVEEL
jgi:hypothetical protein